MTPEHASHLLSRFGGLRIAVVGDLMLDEFISGSVERLSPESSAPVVSLQSTSRSPGGAANVARGLRALGAEAMAVGVVGDDPDGEQLVALLSEQGVDTDRIRIDASRPTTRKSRIIADGEHLTRVDTEARHPLDPEMSARIGADLAALADIDALVVSDYGKGVVDTTVMAAAVQAGRSSKIPLLVDPTHTDPIHYRGSTVLKANLAELASLSGRSPGDDPARWAIETGTDIFRTLELEAMIVTLGDGGLVLLHRGSSPRIMPTPSVAEADVSGAGDTVMTLVALGAAAGLGYVAGCELANLAGGVAVSHSGVAVVSSDELVDAVRTYAAHRVVDIGELCADVEGWRADGDRIVFTNGCFDAFHPGHEHLLTSAAALGDRLVVAVDDDQSVAALKGPGRPLIPQEQRAAAIAVHQSTDRIVFFRSQDLLDMINVLRPDVLVKGDDYRVEDVVGAAEVRGFGGSVTLVERLPGYSTTGAAQPDPSSHATEPTHSPGAAPTG